jgi:hypothetical protein
MKLPSSVGKIKIDSVFKIRLAAVLFIIFYPYLATSMFDVNNQGMLFVDLAFAVGVIIPLGGLWYANKLKNCMQNKS